ncbi:MAG: heme transporter ATP-binding protein [Hyphomicrobiales bacterium]|nr:heme transporter ATP-binding protein [Hyphomicrobiales bacterium]
MSEVLRASDAGYDAGGRRLVDGCNLCVAAGELVVVVGPNGAGKTTLLRLLTGETRPTRGAVFYDRRNIESMSPARLAAKRAVMAQAQTLSFPFTVLDVVRLGLDGVGRAETRLQRERRVERALCSADVTHLAGRDFQLLSGGEQQRVHFARVMAQLDAGRGSEKRQILFLDEPVASLDLCHQLALMDAARAVAADGAAVVAILHDLNLAASYADRLVILQAGRIAAQGPPRAVLDQRLLHDVFKVDLKLESCARTGLPFMLPQSHGRIQPPVLSQ